MADGKPITGLTVWRMPTPASPSVGHLVVRGGAGICYSLPELPRAWEVLGRLEHPSGLSYLAALRWQAGQCPSGESLPEAEALELAAFLGLPEADRPAVVVDRGLVRQAEETMAELEALEREPLARAPEPWRHRREAVSPEEVLGLAGLRRGAEREGDVIG